VISDTTGPGNFVTFFDIKNLFISNVSEGYTYFFLVGNACVGGGV
jgi:hypothetical protein